MLLCAGLLACLAAHLLTYNLQAGRFRNSISSASVKMEFRFPPMGLYGDSISSASPQRKFDFLQIGRFDDLTSSAFLRREYLRQSQAAGGLRASIRAYNEAIQIDTHSAVLSIGLSHGVYPHTLRPLGVYPQLT